MSDGVLIALIGTIGTVAAAYLSFLAGKKRARTEDRAVENQEDQTAIDGWQALAQEYRQDREATKREIAALRQDVDTLRGQVRTLEQEREADRKWKRLALDYIRTLIGALRAVEVPVPIPPAGLVLEDPPSL